MQLTEATERQVSYLQERGFGTRTDIVRIAVDRMYNTEKERPMQLSEFLRQRAGTTYLYRGTVWGDEAYTADAVEFADMLDELDYDGDVLDMHPAYGGMAEGYYEHGATAIGYHALLIDEIVLVDVSEHKLTTPERAGKGLTSWIATCSCGASWRCEYSNYGLEWKPLTEEAEDCPHQYS